MNLEQYFQEPKIFEYSDLTLWEDEYISSLLLNAHLNPHIDDASRNHQFIEDSARWILDQAQASKSLLDLGCGPGLYTQIFKKQIERVVGIDFSTRSIEYAQSVDPDTRYIHQNYLDYHADEHFDTITMIHCEFGSLSKLDRAHMLKMIKNHLSDTGSFYFDVFTPEQLEDFQQTKTWMNRQRSFFSPDPHTELIYNKIYDDHISLRQSTIITKDSVKVYRQWYQYFTLASIKEELEAAGLTIVASYSNLLGDPLTDFSSTIALEVKHQ